MAVLEGQDPRGISEAKSQLGEMLNQIEGERIL
jgi:hypothetical protein